MATGVTVKVDMDLDRINAALDKAQYALDSQVMDDMVQYMPHVTGTHTNTVRAASAAVAGTGIVYAARPPMGRFLYEGKVMVDPVTGSPWARPGAKKIVTERDLTYSNPKATAHWFDTAKKNHIKQWIKLTKKEAGR